MHLFDFVFWICVYFLQILNCLLDIKILGILSQDKQRDGAEPDFVHAEALQAGHAIVRAAGERVLALDQAGMVGQVERLVAGHDCHACHLAVIAQIVAQVIGTGHHHQVAVVKRPAGEVNIPAAVILVVELEVVLVAAAKHTLRHHLCSVEQIIE